MTMAKKAIAKTPIPRRIHRILIAEDEESIREVMAHQFRAAGFDVTDAADGVQALKVLQTQRMDVAILDILMPKKDGLQVLREMKKLGLTEQVPVFVFSNLGQDMDIVTTKKLGIVEYVVKADISIDEVVQKIQRFLKNRKK